MQKDTWKHASECAADAVAKLKSERIPGQFAQDVRGGNQVAEKSTPPNRDATHNSALPVRENP